MGNDKTILIVDDIEVNRVVLAEVFKDEYKIVQADGGKRAIEIIDSGADISAVLLDMLMPDVNGLDVLKAMNENGTIDNIPVFLITAADSDEMLMEAYDMGAIDVIRKPFLTQFLRCRIGNVIELFRHRNKLEEVVEEQVERLSSMNQAMVETLATVIEFRDGETGEHVKNISGLTKILMSQVSKMFPEYAMSGEEIDKIATSAILHDVGKISIPDQILNKPGRLTDEEFDVMRQHTVRGCEILKSIPHILEKGLYHYSYDICRHHHERWDGRGYPDHLSGDDISIWAQVVSVVDVYDALTSERVYKKAFSHEKAVQMIVNGECGAFNPKVLEAFHACMDKINKRKRTANQVSE